MASTPDEGGSPIDAVAFAEKVVALLDTGRKSATYKFATLTALIDACLEQAVPDDAEAVLSARDIGRRVFDQFWRQAVPYSTGDGEEQYLRHSMLSRTAKPDLIVKIEEFRRTHRLGGGITPERAAVLVPAGFAALLDTVVVTLIRMPLPKLQRYNIGGRIVEDRFLYEYGWPDEAPERQVRDPQFDDSLHLGRGVATMLARVGGLLRPVIEARWAAYVAQRSRTLVEHSDVADFLFGADRVSLAPVREPLVDLQRGACFYCARSLGGPPQIDHFVPWVRHPDNGIENLVAAHGACNNRKRDSMAATGHLERWLARNDHDRSRLDAIATSATWPRHPRRTLAAAQATYRWLADGTQLWLRDWDYEPLDRHAIQRLLT